MDVDFQVSTEPEASATPPPTATEAPKDVADEKEVISSPATPLPLAKEKADDSKAFAVVEIANPTDLVKVRLQAEGKLPAGVPRRYSGALNAYSTIVRQVDLMHPLYDR
ncbi:uncharacterized protein A4U43_C05F25450 [Asparagus officinalis]|uniref:Remorin N-terminal domain-containing protein n=1 Tax=Asparagus officinalis TaxID=4686 RepID=A0A5P1EUJ6_ASPOF|nr:uncharacterized protein A4U43_C05F25450 [Asparagus officinalis]